MAYWVEESRLGRKWKILNIRFYSLPLVALHGNLTQAMYGGERISSGEMSKRILIVSNFYYPEKTGIPHYNTEMAEYFVQKGHDVSILTAFPYYPEWKLHKGYRQRFFFSEEIKGVKVLRCPIYIPATVTTKSRILHELSFVFSFMLRALFLRAKYDYILFVSPSLFLFPIARLLKIKCGRNTPLITHIQDLQPDAAVELNMIQNQWLIRFLYKIEAWVYRKSDRVSTISRGMFNRIASKGVSKEKMIFFRNWTDTGSLSPRDTATSFRAKYFQKEDFVVGYSGNMGNKQGLEIILELAEVFLEHPHIRFFVTGNGAFRPEFEAQMRQKKLSNIVILDPQPLEQLNELLATSDIHLIPQKKEVGDIVLPSKLTNLMACGKSVIVGCNPQTSLHDLLQEHNVGLIVQPEKLKDYKEAILQLYGNPQLIQEHGLNARNLAETILDKQFILDQFIQKLRS